MTRNGLRLRIEPVEVWAWNNTRKMLEWRIHNHNSEAAWWRSQNTTPNKEWWRGFWVGFAFFGLCVIISKLTGF